MSGRGNKNSSVGSIDALKKILTVNHVLRLGIACTFIGHGMNAIAIKSNWIPLLTVYGFSVEQAKLIMPVIGMLDISIAVIVFIYPLRMVVMWACFWAFATALTRFIAGEGIWEFIERGSNWAVPMAFLLLTSGKKSELDSVLEKNMILSSGIKLSLKKVLLFLTVIFCTLCIYLTCL